MHNVEICTVLGMGGLIVHRCGLGLRLGLAVVHPQLLCWWLLGEEYMHKNDIRTSHEVHGLILHWLRLELRLGLTADHPWLLCGSLLVRKIPITIIYVLRMGVSFSSENCNVVRLVYPYQCPDYLQLRSHCSPHCPNAKY